MVLLGNLKNIVLVSNLGTSLLQHVEVELFTVRDGNDDGIVETSLLNGWVPELHQFVTLFNVLTLVEVGDKASTMQLDCVDPNVDQKGNTAVGN